MIKRFPNEDAPIWTETYNRTQSINYPQKEAKQQSINQIRKISIQLSIQGRQGSRKQRNKAKRTWRRTVE